MKKKTVPKFLLAQNDKAKSSNQFILHTQEPAFIAEVLHFKSDLEREEFLKVNQDEIIIIDSNKYIVIRKIFNADSILTEYIRRRIVYWYTNQERI